MLLSYICLILKDFDGVRPSISVKLVCFFF